MVPLCERRISFLSDAIGVLSVHRNFIPEFADYFRHIISRQFWSGCISLHLASRISRHIDNLSVCTFFQLFHSTLLESDRAARGRSLFEKRKKIHVGGEVQNLKESRKLKFLEFSNFDGKG